MHHRYRLLFFTALLALICLATNVSQARKLWVATTGSDETGDGSSSYPYRSIGYAVDVVDDTGEDTVYVRPGQYQENIYIPWSWAVALVSEQGAAATVIDLTSTYSVYIDGNGPVLIQGFTIAGSPEPGIYITGYGEKRSTPVVEVRDCEIVDNGSASWSSGGGIRAEGAIVDIHHNRIFSNQVTQRGAGIYCVSTSGRIWNNEISDNVVLNSDGEGGAGLAAVGSDAAELVIQNNLFLSNRADYVGGAMYLLSSLPVVLNNLIYQNEAAEGGGGIFTGNAYRPTIVNNIFSRNSQYAIDCDFSTTPGIYLNNCFHLNLPSVEDGGWCSPDTATNFVGVNPGFVNEVGGDFHLLQSSPLVNGGADISGLKYVHQDYDDHSRIIYGQADVGPYEFIDCNLGVNFSIDPPVVCTSELVSFTILTTDMFQEARWDYGNGDADTLFYGGDWPSLSTSYPIAGDYDVVLTLLTECDTAIGYKTVHVLDRPEAVINSDFASPPCAPLLVAFSAEAEGDDLIYDWRFGDGSTSTLATPQYLYDTAGNYAVTLILANDCGVDTTTSVINVTDVPVADFSAASTTGTAPFTVSFSDNSSRTPNSWRWNFGDGDTASVENPEHTYTSPGQYDVSLAAGNQCGIGEVFARSRYVTVSGFDLVALEVDTSDRFMQEFSLAVDTLFAQFSGQVALKTRFTQVPRRGSATFTLSDSSVSVPDTITATAYLGPTLAQGEYRFAVIGTKVGGGITDTLYIDFRSWPDPLLELVTTGLEFDSTVVDSTMMDSVMIRNIGPFPDPPTDYGLSITNSSTDNTAFVVTNPTTTTPIPTNGGVHYLRIRFTPPDTGLFEATLQIASDDPVAPSVEVPLSGVGIEEYFPPTVVSTIPLIDEENVLIRRTILIELSEQIETSTFDEQSLALFSHRLNQFVFGESSLIQGLFVRFAPATYYPPFDTIDVTLVSTITDLVGNGLDGNLDGQGSMTAEDEFSFSFTTGPAVYPGDCNNDGKVNEVDVLPIGVFYGQTGQVRDLIDPDEDWEAKDAVPWTEPAATYADANGDGTINETDLLTVALNWGEEHEWANPTLPADFDYRGYAENFSRLRGALSAMAGSDVGDQLLRVINMVAPGEVLPTEISLSQNYPNPFNPITRIDYALPEGMTVRLTVHNILGQTVKTLASGYQAAGYKSAFWFGDDESGAQVSSGVYFYRLEAGKYSQIRKMMKLQ